MPLPSEIKTLLEETHQLGSYESHIIAQASEIVSEDPDWRSWLCSPALMSELPLQVSGCLLSYAAALDEVGNPALTVERLERDAAAKDSSADYHERQAESAAHRAISGHPSYRGVFSDQLAAHAECARQDREAAAEIRATARRVARSIVRAQLAASVEEAA